MKTTKSNSQLASALVTASLGNSNAMGSSGKSYKTVYKRARHFVHFAVHVIM
jgi:hypothetical protein